MYPLEMPALCPAAEHLDGIGEDRMFTGVDTHKDTLAVAVIYHSERVVRQLKLPNQDSCYVRLLAQLSRYNVARVGMEGSGNYGGPAAIYPLEHDLNVVDAPPLTT